MAGLYAEGILVEGYERFSYGQLKEKGLETVISDGAAYLERRMSGGMEP